MQPPAAVDSSIALLQRNGMQIVPQSGRSLLSWRATERFVLMSRTACPAWSLAPTESRSMGLWSRGTAGDTGGDSIADGLERGVRPRSLTVFEWIFPTTPLCASAMKQFIKLSTYKAEARFAVT